MPREKTVMNLLFKRMSISCLLAASLGGASLGFAHAQERERREDRQEQSREAQQENQRRVNAEVDQRRQSRLSPEERQALRRQINEAGQDIYVRPRR
jgi:Flp pilus assembly protein TadB